MAVGSVVVEGVQMTELQVGDCVGLVTVFCTGRAICDVKAGGAGSKVWCLSRRSLLRLCEAFPVLAEGLRSMSLKQVCERGIYLRHTGFPAPLLRLPAPRVSWRAASLAHRRCCRMPPGLASRLPLFRYVLLSGLTLRRP